MPTKKVLIAASAHEVLLQGLYNLGYSCDIKEKIKPEEALSQAPFYEGIVTSNKLKITADLIDAAVHLKWIGRLGSGMEIIDVDHALKKGIKCFSSPDGNANAVAEQALGMLLSLKHNIVKANNELKNGYWIREENRGYELEGCMAGIIGYGNNGSAFAKKLVAMGVKVLAYDKNITGYAQEGIMECKDLNPICQDADIISFHVPLNEETKHYFNDDFLSKMKKNFILMNLSRGAVVSMKTLYKGMKSKKITAAALDVWEQEPISCLEDSLQQYFQELIRMSNFIGTPHIGGYTVEATYKMSFSLLQKIKKDFG